MKSIIFYILLLIATVDQHKPTTILSLEWVIVSIQIF